MAASYLRVKHLSNINTAGVRFEGTRNYQYALSDIPKQIKNCLAVWYECKCFGLRTCFRPGAGWTIAQHQPGSDDQYLISGDNHDLHWAGVHGDKVTKQSKRRLDHRNPMTTFNSRCTSVYNTTFIANFTLVPELLLSTRPLDLPAPKALG